MIIRPLSDILARLKDSSIRRLKNILHRSEVGYDVDLRSPLADGKPRDEIVAEWRERLGEFGHPEMDDIDDHEESKVGTSSIQLPFDELREDLYAYFKVPNPSGDRKCFEKARADLINLLPFRSLRSESLDIAFGDMPEGTNLGLPELTRDKTDAYLYLDRAKSVRSADDFYPFMLFRRVQPNGTTTPKQRHVMGADHIDTILWRSLTAPLLIALRRVSGFAAWGTPDDVDIAVTELLNHAQRNSRKVVSGDHKGFDWHMSANVINVVFDALESWFSSGDSSRINLLREVFLTTGVVCPDGWITDRYGGVMSGGGFTNGGDSLGNRFASLYCAYRTETRLERNEVMGDDFLSVWSRDITEHLQDLMGEIGFEVSRDKQFISSNSCHFLQKWHSLDYMRYGVAHGVKSPIRALNGMMSYEHLRSGWNKYMDSVRWMMQAEQVRWDIRFPTFVALLKENDEVLRSGIDPVEVARLAGGSAKIRRVLGLQSYPFSNKDPEGLENFEVVKLLRAS